MSLDKEFQDHLDKSMPVTVLVALLIFIPIVVLGLLAPSLVSSTNDIYVGLGVLLSFATIVVQLILLKMLVKRIF